MASPESLVTRLGDGVVPLDTVPDGWPGAGLPARMTAVVTSATAATATAAAAALSAWEDPEPPARAAGGSLLAGSRTFERLGCGHPSPPGCWIGSGAPAAGRGLGSRMACWPSG